jgi:hypothetical protein
MIDFLNEKEVQSSFRALQAKYPKLLGGREPMVRRETLAGGFYEVSQLQCRQSAD